MKAFAIRFRQWTAWLDKRSLRERVLLLVVVLVLGGFVADALFFHPQGIKRRQLHDQITAMNAAVAELDRQADAIKVRAQQDPDREPRARQQQLQMELDQLDGRLKALTVDLISPRDMAEVLRELLTRQAGMKLVRLENLPPIELLPASKDDAEVDDEERPNLYRHPVHIVMSGTYLQALDYLRDLEKLPRKLFWDDLEIVVGDYPQTEITLTVYTLSVRKGWIGV
ncbi:MAG: type II secretion system protein GspM [Pedobacter sp.]